MESVYFGKETSINLSSEFVRKRQAKLPHNDTPLKLPEKLDYKNWDILLLRNLDTKNDFFLTICP